MSAGVQELRNNYFQLHDYTSNLYIQIFRKFPASQLASKILGGEEPQVSTKEQLRPFGLLHFSRTLNSIKLAETIPSVMTQIGQWINIVLPLRPLIGVAHNRLARSPSDAYHNGLQWPSQLMDLLFKGYATPQYLSWGGSTAVFSHLYVTTSENI